MTENRFKAELKTLVAKLDKMADSFWVSSETRRDLQDAAKWLTQISWNVCGQGYVGCRGGDKCDSDHK